MDAFWRRLGLLWDRHPAFSWGLTLCGLFGVIATAFWPQSPGVSIGLLALAAGIMSVRPNMHSAEKFAWVVVLISFAILEVRAIHRTDLENKNQRDEQLAQFEAISDGMKATIEQTRPHAALRIADFKSPDANVTRAGDDSRWDFTFVNDGDQAADLKRGLAALYVSRPDDENSQLGLSKRFEQEWNNTLSWQDREIQPKTPGFWSIHRKFSKDEISQVSKGDTIYILERLEYSDSLGLWFADRCEGLQVQDGKLSTRTLHPCSVFTRNRYPAKPQ